ncbi:hypothetical protein [Parasphingorhabdus sp.]|uniref:hypothetical protein n=1 Tax=Parasphingorhabdus sp. TaxID=2709688 RepID=UPI002F9389F8
MFVVISLAARTTIAQAGYMDGADAPALFSVTRETVWAALPARPTALRRNPASRVFHVVAALQVRLITAGLLVALAAHPASPGPVAAVLG